jgi:hypothetical protein
MCAEEDATSATHDTGLLSGTFRLAPKGSATTLE